MAKAASSVPREKRTCKRSKTAARVRYRKTHQRKEGKTR